MFSFNYAKARPLNLPRILQLCILANQLRVRYFKAKNPHQNVHAVSRVYNCLRQQCPLCRH